MLNHILMGLALHVDNIYIMNIGIPARQEEILRYGMGFILTPKNFNARYNDCQFRTKASDST